MTFVPADRGPQARTVRAMSTNEVIVGIDGSQASIEALRWAMEYARRTGTTVVPVHTWEIPFVGDLTGAAVMPDPRLLREGAQAVLDRSIAAAGPPPDVDVRPEVLEGSPAMRLIERSADADLLVVGARGHGGFVGLLVGSVATQCVNHAKVPVVVVPRRPTDDDRT
jgi:nucleotide-binding universal stress UspA family protein